MVLVDGIEGVVLFLSMYVWRLGIIGKGEENKGGGKQRERKTKGEERKVGGKEKERKVRGKGKEVELDQFVCN